MGISGIDTRALTRHLRERGAMRVGISTDSGRRRGVASTAYVQQIEWKAPTWPARSRRVNPYVVPAIGERRFTVAAIDLGIKSMTPHRMAQRGIEVHVLPATSSIDDVLGGRARRGVLLQRPG